MTTTIFIILALWLVPGFLAYIIASLSSDEWDVDDDDKILLVPVVNFVMLILVVMITIEDVMDKISKTWTEK